MSNYLMQGRNIRYPVLGGGPKFPWQFSAKGSTLTSVATSSDVAHINERIWQLLCTRRSDGDAPGEDDSLPTRGSLLHTLLYKPIGPAFRGLVMAYIFDPIQTLEKQIQLGELTFLSSALDEMGKSSWDTAMETAAALEKIERGIEEVNIPYVILTTQQPGNCVFPFYIDSDMVVQGYGYVY